MLTRVLLLALVIAVVVMIVRRSRVHRDSAAAAPPVDTKTVRCAYCAVYFPRHEAIVSGGLSYCSHAHAERAPPRG